jgi:hypothetical protein
MHFDACNRAKSVSKAKTRWINDGLWVNSGTDAIVSIDFNVLEIEAVRVSRNPSS